MPTQVILFEILLLFYALVGEILLYLNRKSVIIKYRKPQLAMLEAFFMMIVSMIEVLDWPTKAYLGCTRIDTISTVIGTWCVALTVTRYAYLYSTVFRNKPKGDNFWFHLSSVLVENSRIKTVALLSLISAMTTISVTYSVLFYVITGESCGAKFTMVAIVLSYLGIICVFGFTVQLIKFKVKDKIGMSTELISNCASLFLIICVYYISKMFVSGFDWSTLAFCTTNMFFCLYFPNFKLIHYNMRRKRKTRENWSTVIIPGNFDLINICKIHLCEEMAHFIDKYNEYKKGNCTFDEIVNLFVISGSPFELNINSSSKIKMIKAGRGIVIEEQELILDLVYIEVCIILKEIISKVSD